jgi:hypothetical protein
MEAGFFVGQKFWDIPKLGRIFVACHATKNTGVNGGN